MTATSTKVDACQRCLSRGPGFGEKLALREESLRAKARGHAGDMGPDTRLPGTCSHAVPSTAGREPGPQPHPGSQARSAACQAPPAARLAAMGLGMLHGSLLETRGPNCWQGKATPACFSQEHGVYGRRLPIAQASGKPLSSVQTHPNSGKLFLSHAFIQQGQFSPLKNGYRSAHSLP